MTFGALPLWGVLATCGLVAAVVVVLYLLRRTPRPQQVSNVDFWMAAVQRARPRVLSSTRIPLLALLVTLLAALLLVVSIGGPRFGEGVRGTTVIVIAADRTMKTSEAGLTRLERAIDEAEAWADRATASGEVAVIRAGVRPRVLVALTEDSTDVERGLAGLRADDGEADVAAALAVADALVRQRGGVGQVLLVADRPLPARTGAPLIHVPVGGVADSLGITHLSARRDPIAVGEYVVQVEVGSFTSRRGRARLVVRDRDVTIFDQPFTLGPGERLAFRAQGFSSAQGEVEARLEDIEIAGAEDALAGDDVAYAVAPALGETRVLLVSSGNPHLELVLSAHGALDVERVAPDALGALGADALAQHDVVILDRPAPGTAIPHPGVLVIGGRGAQGIVATEELRAPRVRATLASHPALGGLRLDSIRIERARAIDPEPGDQVLLRDGRHALAVAREEPGRRALALGFDFGSSDLVERVAFPLLIHHATLWLAGRGSGPLASSLPGDPVEVVDGTTVLGPEGEPVETAGGRVVDTTRAGIYHVGERAVAVSAAELAKPIPAPALHPAPRGTSALPPLAVLVTALLLLVMAGEWLLVHRGRLG